MRCGQHFIVILQRQASRMNVEKKPWVVPKALCEIVKEPQAAVAEEVLLGHHAVGVNDNEAMS